MSYNILRLGNRCLLVAALSVFAVQFVMASDAPVLSGSYEIVHDTALGSQAQVQIRIHLVNHGPSDFSVQRMTFWDFSHPEKGGSHACDVVLHAQASAEITQEFTIRRSDYLLWEKGLRPRLVLQLAGPGGAKSTAVVRLDRTSGQEAK